MRFLPACGVFLLLLVSTSASAGYHHWTINGPDGGTVSKLAYDPQDSAIVYAASANGIFRSSDGGRSWSAASELLGTSVFDVAVAASDPEIVYASTSYGLYKSIDRGSTWKVVHGFGSFKVEVSRQSADVVYSSSGSGPIRSSDGGVTFGPPGSGLPGQFHSVSAIAVDPLNADIVYASFISSAGVYKTVNGGASWTPAKNGLTSPLYYTLVVDPSNSSTLYVGGGGAIFKSVNAGASWSEFPTGLSSPYCYSLAISGATTPSTLVAGTSVAVIKTVSGSGWTPPLALAPAASLTVGIDPHNAGNILAVSGYRLFGSVDGGADFSPSGDGLDDYYTNAIAVDPRNDSLVYAGGPAGMFKSLDLGESWSPSGPVADYVAVDPFDSLTLYAISSGAVKRSVDGGVVWNDFRDGLPFTAARFIATDPVVAGTLCTIVANAPYVKVGSAPWVIRNNGLPTGGTIWFLVADPRSASVLYVGVDTRIYKSVDGGVNWSPSSNGLGSETIASMAVDPHDASHLLSTTQTKVYESKNGGGIWTRLVGVEAGALAFDPSRKGRLCISSYSSVNCSNDAGASWFPVTTGLGRTHGDRFVFAPNGRTLYSGGSSGGVWTYQFARQHPVRR